MSGAKLLLDTNIVIGLLKGYDPAVQLVSATGLHLAQAAVSQITRMELLGYPGITLYRRARHTNLAASYHVHCH